MVPCQDTCSPASRHPWPWKSPRGPSTNKGMAKMNNLRPKHAQSKCQLYLGQLGFASPNVIARLAQSWSHRQWVDRQLCTPWYFHRLQTNKVGTAQVRYAHQYIHKSMFGTSLVSHASLVKAKRIGFCRARISESTEWIIESNRVLQVSPYLGEKHNQHNPSAQK